MVLKYSDIFHQNSYFQRAVNLSLDAGKLDFVDHYIPTKASASVLKRYLKAVLNPSQDRASVLIGPYGKGKSHTMFLVLSMLSEDGEVAERSFALLADRLENVDPEAATLVRQIRSNGIRLLPVVINNRYLNIRQAFLASIKSSLEDNKLSALLPNNFFSQCLSVINRWRNDFPDTYRSYISYLNRIGTSPSEFQAKLEQFDAEALQQFRDCHKAILSGAEFDPLIESDVPTLFDAVASSLKKSSKFCGIFVVFDEFGKYLESIVDQQKQPNFDVLQDFAELCSRSKDSRMLISCISHKTISSYAEHASETQLQSFRTVEGRFSTIYYTSNFEGNFSLIAGALGRNANAYQLFVEQHIEEHQKTVEECESLGCFSGYESSVSEIVDQCFPMHPLTALSLIKMSERAAQNERTLFTYLADQSSPMAHIIQKNTGEYELDTVEPVYDWFHSVVREDREDRELRETVIFTDSLLPTLTADESKLVKAIVLFDMVTDPCLSATKQILTSALQWSSERYDNTVQNLEKAHRIYTRRSDGVLCLMHTAADSVRLDIDHEIKLRHDRRMDIAGQLAELRAPGYTIPRRYNDRFSMVRWFNNVYISADHFFMQRDSRFLKSNGIADGYVLYLLGNAEPEEVQQQLRAWNDNSIIVLVPKIKFTAGSSIEECAAIGKLLQHEQDETIKNELVFYYEDMLQVVGKAFARLFEENPYCVSIDNIITCTNPGPEVSRLCEDLLYPLTPAINHEMINRTDVSGQMRQARTNVINTILSNSNWEEAYDRRKAEYPILRAILGHLDNPRMQKIIEIIEQFVSGCEQHKQPVSNLYEILLKSPYGLRRGVLPILIAYVLKGDKDHVTLFNHNQELPLDGDTLAALNDHVDDYELLVDRGNPEQAAYLHALHDEYTPSDPSINIRAIHDALSQIVRSLPRSARASKLTLEVRTDAVSVVPIAETLVGVRTQLVQFNSNSRDILLEKIPAILGISPSSSCAMKLIDSVAFLQKYTKVLGRAIEKMIVRRLVGSDGQSLRGAMTSWYQKLPEAKLQHIYSSSATGFLNVCACKDNHTDIEWINMCATALTGLPIEDWSDVQVQGINENLNLAITEIEKTEVKASSIQSTDAIVVALGGKQISHSLENEPLEGLNQLLYHTMKSAINDYGDALTSEDKLLVLANLILHLNDKD